MQLSAADSTGRRNTERLTEAGIEPSVGSRDDSYDNALAETINGLYKAELIHRRAPWKTRESLEPATFAMGALVQPHPTAGADWIYRQQPRLLKLGRSVIWIVDYPK